ncbi:MAG: ATP-dependent Clp protease proteolytic subunit [Anaerolineae bacterium]|nr:ATP-dependent Clp protease proteolytic subunit [Anaerolineae bacterium]
MDENQRKLLEEKHTIILPDDIDHDTYQFMLEALMEHPGRVKLYCNGDGGSARDALAIVDLIQQHGDVVGLLVGMAVSSHVTVWASCKTRYISPNGGIGVHRVASRQTDSLLDAHRAQLIAEEYGYIEDRVARIYSAASCLNTEKWVGILNQAGSDWYAWYGADYLINVLEMARPLSEFVDGYKAARGVLAPGKARLVSGGELAPEMYSVGDGVVRPDPRVQWHPFEKRLITDEQIELLQRLGYRVRDTGDQATVVGRYFDTERLINGDSDNGAIIPIAHSHIATDAWVKAWQHALDQGLVKSE